MRVSTQADNLRVQRTWAREGFRLESVEHTVHVSPLLSVASRFPDRIAFGGPAVEVAAELLRRVSSQAAAQPGASIQVSSYGKLDGYFDGVIRVGKFPLNHGGIRMVAAAFRSDADMVASACVDIEGRRQ
jgi:hypothetical protein